MNHHMILMMFIMSMFMFTFYYKHLLLSLISLEFMMINLFHNMFYIMNLLNMNMYLMSLILSISICEGIMGLSVLVYLIRMSGNDYLKLMPLMKW